MTVGEHEPVGRTARLAGGLYLSLVPLGFFSFVYVPSVIVVRGDAAATCRNIVGSPALFLGGTASHLVTQIVVVFLALALHRLLGTVNARRAMLMVVLALLGIPIAFVSEVYGIAALRLLAGADDRTFAPAQLQAHAMLLLDMRRTAVLLAQVFWGLWLLPLGALVLASGFLPRFLGIAVLIGAAGYLIDSCTQLSAARVPTISQFTVGAEVLLPLWLLLKGTARAAAPRP